MPARRRRSALILVLVAAFTATVAPAGAQPQSGALTQAREAARALAEHGLDLFAAKKFAEAIASFEEAELRFHAPTHLLFQARAYAKLGKLAKAKELYEKVVAEQLANYAPEGFREAQANARTELGVLNKRVPSLRVTVTGVSSPRVTIDGQLVASIAKPIALDPGEHAIVATADGAEPVTKNVTLVEGAGLAVDFALTPAALPAPTAPPPLSPAPPPPEARGSIVPGVVVLGVGVVGVAIGAITGATSLSKVSTLSLRCPTKHGCDPADQALADSAKTLGTVSTIGFVIGGVGLAAGAVLLVVRPGKPAAPATGLTVTPRIGLGSLAFEGTF